MVSSAMSIFNNWTIAAVSGASSGKAGLFSTLQKGANNLAKNWDKAAAFGGAVCVLVAIAFLVIAVVKSRDKGRWYWSAGIAFAIGAVLIVSGSVNKIQGYFSNTNSEIFGMIDFFGTMSRTALNAWFGI